MLDIIRVQLQHDNYRPQRANVYIKSFWESEYFNYSIIMNIENLVVK